MNNGVPLNPVPLEGYSVMTADEDPNMKAVVLNSAAGPFAFPINREIAQELADLFQKLANELPPSTPPS